MSKPAKRLEAVSEFRSDEEAGAFRRSHDAAEYLDSNRTQPVRFAKLRPSTATISLRLPQVMLEELRVLTNEKDAPYQSLLKANLAERSAEERRPARQRRRASVWRSLAADERGADGSSGAADRWEWDGLAAAPPLLSIEAFTADAHVMRSGTASEDLPGGWE